LPLWLSARVPSLTPLHAWNVGPSAISNCKGGLRTCSSLRMDLGCYLKFTLRGETVYSGFHMDLGATTSASVCRVWCCGSPLCTESGATTTHITWEALFGAKERCFILFFYYACLLCIADVNARCSPPFQERSGSCVYSA
jgi:hypothetical protein